MALFRRSKLFAVVTAGGVLVASVALAAAYGGTFALGGPQRLAAYFQGGLFVGNGAAASTANRITAATSNATALNYDFAPLTGTHATCHTAVTTATVTGCAFPDVVSMGVDQTIAADIMFFPYVSAANTVSLRACAVGITDGGTADMPDASYTFRCLSSRTQ